MPLSFREQARSYNVPFGGRKGSSYGSREQGRYAQEFYTVVKTSYIGS
ncbi:aldehyde dehydrogenase family protein [Pseudomonas veronii]|nr:hypothetical protein [Pseudomonas veronii]WKC45460.1 hypothetical protein QYP03_21930 [Pseudomonas veronii]